MLQKYVPFPPGNQAGIFIRAAGPQGKKTCLQGLTNNKGTDQTGHLRSLISAFVIRLLETIIIWTCYKRYFNFLASLYIRAGWFESHFVRNPEDRFSHVKGSFARE